MFFLWDKKNKGKLRGRNMKEARKAETLPKAWIE